MMKIVNIKYDFNLIVLLSACILLISSYIIFSTNNKQESGGRRNTCVQLNNDVDKVQCWKKLIDTDLSRGDLDKSMDLVAEFYETDQVFASNCHDFTHSVGKKAYEMFSQGIKFKVGNKTGYCAYGFYHGFMESLVSQSGNIEMARDFCTLVDNELSKISSAAKLACYHGIGHGWTNVHDKKLWGNERAMTEPAIKLCEKVANDPEELKFCVTGVFDSISIGYYNLAYDLKINKSDPYWLCKVQKEVYKTPCYMDLTPAIVWMGDYRLDKSLKYISKVESKYKDLVIRTISEDMVRFIIRDNLNLEDQVKICRLLGSKSGICIQGITSGYLQFGPPKNEEKLAMNFCSSDFLTTQEKTLCYSILQENVKWVYSDDKYKAVCGEIPDQYKNVCVY